MREICKFHNLLWIFVKRDLKTRYAGSLMGIFWSLIHPLITLLIFTFVFSYLLKIDFKIKGGTGGYALYLFTGMLPWFLIQEALLRSTPCLVDNKNLVKSSLFPRKIIPLSLVLSSFVNFLLGFLILCIFLFSSGHHPDGNWIALPLIFFLQLIFTSGLSFFCSTLNLFFRDIVHLIGVILMVWLYLTPVFYPETLVPVRFHYALYFNPMAHLVSLFRNILLLDTIPVKSLSVFSIFAFSFFIGGFFLFSHQERIMSDYL